MMKKFTPQKSILLAIAFMIVTNFGAVAADWSGTKTYDTSATISEKITVSGNTTVNVLSNITITVTGDVSGNWVVTKTGAGTLILAGTNDVQQLDITGGTVYIGNGQDKGTLNCSVSLASGTNLYFRRSNEYTFPNWIVSATAGAGKVFKAGAGKTIFTQNHQFTGTIQVQAGTLQIGNGGTTGNINNVAGVTIDAGATLRFEPGADVIFSKKITGDGKVEYKGGSGTTNRLKFTANNTYSGTTTVEAGVLHIGAGTDTGDIVGEIIVNQGAYFDFERSNAYTFDGVISGKGNVAKWNDVTLTINKEQKYEGYTHIRGGTIALASGGSIASSSYVELFGTAKLNVTAGSGLLPTKTIKNLISSSADAEVVMTTTTNVLSAKKLQIGTSATSNDGGGTFAGKFTGGIYASLTKTGTSTLYLTGANTSTGGLTISAGTLYIGNNTQTGVYTGPITNNATLVFDRSNTYTFDKDISGSGVVTHYGTGDLTLSGSLTYTGMTNIRAGKLIIGGSTSLESSEGVTFTSNSNPKLDVSSGDKTIKSLSGATTYTTPEVILGSRTLTIGTTGNTGTGTFYGIFSGSSGKVTKKGTGTFTMSGTNTAAGLFHLTAGKLIFSKQWEGPFTQESGTTLEIVGSTLVGAGATARVLTLRGGEMNFDVTKATLPQLTATGSLSASGTTKLNVTSGTTANQYTLIKASAGVSPLDFQLYTPGVAANLSASTATHLILKVTGAGIEDIPEAAFYVYPNPTKGELRISNDELEFSKGINPLVIVIYDIAGKAVFMSPVSQSSKETLLDISHLPAGLYFMNTGKGTVKIVKQ